MIEKGGGRFNQKSVPSSHEMDKTAHSGAGLALFF